MTMKKPTIAAMIATLGIVAFESYAAAEQKFQRLTGAQIQAKFPGMELTDEAHWGEVFGDNVHGPHERRQVADPEGPALSRHWKRAGRRLLRGVALRKKRGVTEPGLERALGSHPSKACQWQIVDDGF
jgi:hypothetical protein